MNTSEFKINKGTISFWIKENKLLYNDNQTTPIFSTNPDGGSIFMVKDGDNKIKVFYVVLGKGRIDLEYDVSNLNSSIKHMFTFTWSLDDQKMILYIDGQEKMLKEIKFI
jgi:hypothetical protein